MVDFSLYTEIAKWVGWPAVSAALVFLIAAIIYFYNEYTKILKEKNNQLLGEIENYKAYNFDQLLIRLQERHKAAMGEIDRLIKEVELKDHELQKGKKDLEGVRKGIEKKGDELSKQIARLKVEVELAKTLAKRREIEVNGILAIASEMAKDYREKIATLNKE